MLFKGKIRKDLGWVFSRRNCYPIDDLQCTYLNTWQRCLRVWRSLATYAKSRPLSRPTPHTLQLRFLIKWIYTQVLIEDIKL